MRGSAVLALVALMLLSGCTAPPEEGDPLPTEGTTFIDPNTGDVRVLHHWNATFGADAQAMAEEFEDTFTAGEHWTYNGEFQALAGVDSGSAHVRDISAMVPRDVPVRLVAEVQAEMTEGDVDLWFNLPADAAWTSVFDTPFGGYSRIEFVVVRTTDDPISVGVFYDEIEPAQTVAYVLRVEAHVDPLTIAPGVPVLVDVPAAATRVDVLFNGTSGALLAWDPQDLFLGRFAAVDGAVNLTPERPGAYVLLVPQGGAPAMLRVWSTEPPPAAALALRAAKQDIQNAATEPIVVNEPAALTFEAAKVPIQVGLEVRIADFSQGASGTLDSPEGNLITYDFQDDLPFTDAHPMSSLGFLFLTPMGAAGLVTGTYTGTFSGEPNGSGELLAWVVYYAR